MKGSAVKRSSSWGAIWDEPVPIDGKRKQRWRSGFKTKREAEQYAREQLALRDAGTYVAPARLTVADFSRDWLPAASRRLRPTTVERYSVALERQVLPALGAIRLQALAPARIVAFYTELEEAGLSPSSIRVAATVLRRMLRDAERWGHLQRSPASNGRLTRARTITCDSLDTGRGRSVPRSRARRPPLPALALGGRDRRAPG
jgi:Arm DNA-binding domain/Phage integrase, N-terminal SAM-like domain